MSHKLIPYARLKCAYGSVWFSKYGHTLQTAVEFDGTCFHISVHHAIIWRYVHQMALWGTQNGG